MRVPRPRTSMTAIAISRPICVQAMIPGLGTMVAAHMSRVALRWVMCCHARMPTTAAMTSRNSRTPSDGRPLYMLGVVNLVTSGSSASSGAAITLPAAGRAPHAPRGAGARRLLRVEDSRLPTQRYGRQRYGRGKAPAGSATVGASSRNKERWAAVASEPGDLVRWQISSPRDGPRPRTRAARSDGCVSARPQHSTRRARRSAQRDGLRVDDAGSSTAWAGNESSASLTRSGQHRLPKKTAPDDPATGCEMNSSAW